MAGLFTLSEDFWFDYNIAIVVPNLMVYSKSMYFVKCFQGSCKYIHDQQNDFHKLTLPATLTPFFHAWDISNSKITGKNLLSKKSQSLDLLLGVIYKYFHEITPANGNFCYFQVKVLWYRRNQLYPDFNDYSIDGKL